MELKAIIGIALVVFIVGGFIFLQIRNRKKKVRTSAGAGLKNSAPSFYFGRLIMRNLKTIENRVLAVLKEHPRSTK